MNMDAVTVVCRGADKPLWLQYLRGVALVWLLMLPAALLLYALLSVVVGMGAEFPHGGPVPIATVFWVVSSLLFSVLTILLIRYRTGF